MSHFTEVKTEIRDLKILAAALDQLGLTHQSQVNGVEIQNFFGDKTCCEMRIETGTSYAIGVKVLPDGTYELIADWELLAQCKVDVVGLRAKIAQRYSYCLVKDRLESQGYSLQDESLDEDGNLQMVVTQW